jgi:hypothetical protein
VEMLYKFAKTHLPQILPRRLFIEIFVNRFLGRNRKRRKVDLNDVEDKLESLINRVGEKVYNLSLAFI